MPQFTFPKVAIGTDVESEREVGPRRDAAGGMGSRTQAIATAGPTAAGLCREAAWRPSLSHPGPGAPL